jgi:DNA helicase II / ATP-dependent DNA helicase PcrA
MDYLSQPLFCEGVGESVLVMTAHKAKGLEFEVVFIPHLVDSAWGGSRSRSEAFDLPIRKHEVDDEKLLTEDDERRLLYVAFTRAKRRLFCSYSATSVEGRSYSPSRFLVDLNAHFVQVDVAAYEEGYDALSGLGRTIEV